MNHFQKAARAFADAFKTDTRKDGTAFVCLNDAQPWMNDAVHAAHGDALPDDTIYKLCESAASYIADNHEDESEAEEGAHAFADSEVDTYNSDRTEWLNKNLAHSDYVDRAVEELGHSKDGLFGDIALGQYTQAFEVYGAILRGITDEAENAEACDFKEKNEED